MSGLSGLSNQALRAQRRGRALCWRGSCGSVLATLLVSWVRRGGRVAVVHQRRWHDRRPVTRHGTGHDANCHRLPRAGRQRPEGLAAVPRHDDVRRPHRPGRAGRSSPRPRRGVNFIDTADVYASGESEEIVGRLIARRPRRTGSWRPRWPTRWATRPTSAACRGAGSYGRSSEPAAAGHRLGRHLLPAPRRRRARRWMRRCATLGAPDARRQDPLLRPFQLPRLADRRDRGTVRSARACRGAACASPYYNAMNRSPRSSCCRPAPLRGRRRPLQPARPRRAHRQVPADRRRPKTRAPPARTSA